MAEGNWQPWQQPQRLSPARPWCFAPVPGEQQPTGWPGGDSPPCLMWMNMLLL